MFTPTSFVHDVEYALSTLVHFGRLIHQNYSPCRRDALINAVAVGSLCILGTYFLGSYGVFPAVVISVYAHDHRAIQAVAAAIFFCFVLVPVVSFILPTVLAAITAFALTCLYKGTSETVDRHVQIAYQGAKTGSSTLSQKAQKIFAFFHRQFAA